MRRTADPFPGGSIPSLGFPSYVLPDPDPGAMVSGRGPKRDGNGRRCCSPCRTLERRRSATERSPWFRPMRPSPAPGGDGRRRPVRRSDLGRRYLGGLAPPRGASSRRYRPTLVDPSSPRPRERPLRPVSLRADPPPRPRREALRIRSLRRPRTFSTGGIIEPPSATRTAPLSTIRYGRSGSKSRPPGPTGSSSTITCAKTWESSLSSCPRSIDSTSPCGTGERGARPPPSFDRPSSACTPRPRSG